MMVPPIPRRKTRVLSVGGVKIGGDNPIVVQSMCVSPTHDAAAVIKEILGLEEAGCEIVRVSVPDKESAAALPEILRNVNIPVIADIHFDFRMALLAAEAGVQGLRINPGNIGKREKVQEVVRACKSRGIPMRIGVNGGSLEKHLLEKYGCPTPEAMVESALEHIKILEDEDFTDIKVSLKSSNVRMTVAAYRLLADKVDYPFHLGITEAGTAWSGAIKSSIGLGILLHDGLGDTVRVSLSADPREEVKVAFEILKDLGIRERGITLVSCPSCARAQVDQIALAQAVEQRLGHIKAPMTVAVMGCAVNGPG
ncbi:MAG: flavodoxin-dependent (E)-4-hydroxy-3-methylbut-2-enyl-diphosphate synthase, partial [Candidatus Methylomirabilis sp.]|nr:flavodoxin-dependent (E)-4-hydroxy-3-methylbut-2-enyl-diphosphate synthase [Deltaproteobacteria bacterium]